jgi:hypothetical protein
VYEPTAFDLHDTITSLFTCTPFHRYY